MLRFRTIQYKRGSLLILDQRQLPGRLVYFKAKNANSVYRAIKDMALRGAPLIGVAAAYGIAIEAQRVPHRNYPRRLRAAVRLIQSARPTARNLSWACERMLQVINKYSVQPRTLRQALLQEARRIEAEDVVSCDRIGQYGAQLIKNGSRLMVYCNAGALATAGIGTALAVIYKAHGQGKKFTVYACETGPGFRVADSPPGS